MDNKFLIKIDENNLFYKIKRFIRRLFSKEKNSNNQNDIVVERKEDTRNNLFMDSVKKIEDEETKLLKLQKAYRSGTIKEENMTKEQISSLCALYDKQILALKESNARRKQKLLEYRKNMQSNY